jgi:hypothetical protein
MVDKFYSQRHLERVQQIENKSKGFNSLLVAGLIALFVAVLGTAGRLDYESDTLESATPYSALEQVYEPMDIQPAYGVYQFQDATSGWTLQGDIIN